MSTYAKYCLWAGCKREEIANAPATADEFIRSVACMDLTGIERDSLRFTDISMHGESVGIGVVVHDLGWETEIGANNDFDLGIADRANDVLARVRSIFRDLGITTEPKLYHHLDLGG